MVTIPSMQDLLEAGVHFGHQTRRSHPHMAEYIFGVREGVHIINLEDSEKKLQEAADFAYQLGLEGKVLLLVGTKKQAQPIVAEAGKRLNIPYVDFRWVGGTLTNFDEVKKNLKVLTNLKNQQEKGELSRYTKKEQLLISRRLSKFETEWGGIVKMDKLPDALFIIDCVTEKIAVKEANTMSIPVIGIADTNCDPASLAFPIPSNDDAIKAIKIVTEAIVSAYEQGLKKSKNVAEEKETKPKAEEKTKKEAEEPEATDAVIAADVAAAEEVLEKEELKEAGRVE